MFDRHASAHAYARRNGYKGTYAEYQALQYKTYCETCKRCEVKPMPRADWDAKGCM